MDTRIYKTRSLAYHSTAGIAPIALTSAGAAFLICPKGWTLPSVEQIRSIGPDAGSTTYVSNFSPVLGGNYANGKLYFESTRGFWWGSTMFDGAARYLLYYYGSSLYTYNVDRVDGFYVRCIQAS